MGTIKVNFPPCELGASVWSASGLAQLSSVYSKRTSWTLHDSSIWSSALDYFRRRRRRGYCGLLDLYHGVRSIEVPSKWQREKTY